MCKDMPQGVKSVSDEEIIEAIQCHKDPFVMTVEIAERFEHTRQWAHDRLDQLHAEGRVNKKGGKRSVIWWPKDY